MSVTPGLQAQRYTDGQLRAVKSHADAQLRAHCGRMEHQRQADATAARAELIAEGCRLYAAWLRGNNPPHSIPAAI